MQLRMLLTVAAAMALVGCSDSDAEPTGQVVATVGGEEITASELNMELGGVTASDPQQQEQLRQAALQALVNRAILSEAAEEAGVLEGPSGAIVQRKAEQLSAIELLRSQLSGQVPRPSVEEAQEYIADNPAQFSQRRVFLVDQIVVPNPPEGLVRRLEPVETMAQAREVLRAADQEANVTVGVIDALTIAPEAARQIADLPPGEVFIIPTQNALRINTIREEQVQPVTGDAAVQIARELLMRSRTQAQVNRAIGDILAQKRGEVKYNPEFAPEAPAKGT